MIQRSGGKKITPLCDDKSFICQSLENREKTFSGLCTNFNKTGKSKISAQTVKIKLQKYGF